MQVEPVFAGIGMAHVFNRSLVLPRVACYCDKCAAAGARFVPSCWPLAQRS